MKQFQDFKIIETDYSGAVKYVHVAHHEGKIGFRNTANTVWFISVSPKNNFAGMAAVFFVTPEKARIKSVYVRPDFRGRGLGLWLTDYVTEWAVDNGAEEITVLAKVPDFYKKLGWQVSSIRSNGGAKMTWKPPAGKEKD